MSDTPQGPGWWQASDGRFYPPQQHPNAVAEVPTAPARPDPWLGSAQGKGSPAPVSQWGSQASRATSMSKPIKVRRSSGCFTRVLAVLGALAVILIVIAGIAGMQDGDTLKSGSDEGFKNGLGDNPTLPTPDSGVPTPPATDEPSASETVSQKNARRSAASYLEFTSFSRSGLIKQLEFEGFSQADATYGVDTMTVNWSEQAAKSATSYLEFTSFSRSGLIQQLVFEGFTQAEAEYGVSATGL